jgi:hypothetical protein
MNKFCICTSAAARYRCRYNVPGTNDCDATEDDRFSFDPNPRQSIPTETQPLCGIVSGGMHKPVHQHEHNRKFWLKLAKNERQHAQENLQKMKDKGDDYAANVYKVRIKALVIYIKQLEKKGGEA